MNIRVRGISYHFVIHQDKEQLPALVLLHGFMGSFQSFDHLIPELRSFCNPITIDLLGHGKSEGAELHYRFSTKEQVADLSKLISEQLHIPLYLYGYSMGGRLALQLALHQPHLFRGLILESSTFGIEDETERQARQSLDARRSDDLTGNFKGFLESWQKMPLFASSTAEKELLKRNKEIQQHQNPFWLANSLQGFGTGTMPCARDRLGELKVPVHLIAGEKDSKFVHINRTMEKEIADAKLHSIKEAGHRVHLDQPEAVISVMEKALAV
ncbi:2-succinyl-6-hydroxy-2,4-cyclohexadiene-1-carboxylate synthase [Gracilimonas mengyeensis]|uniref:Putative 2-succinyl-6-hydroxy-2,4-cyclohexadiene-1-carboxylate synthase n=1 Tax=Gracilimonas mengyeensis TaxID=1302730 RepID=A0A521AMP6_9BACT|nr:2-succinyl-6-hydroxy-2,4-cyclohexadiene-1-carboxylate synthase [Gracilimonas mengyeensis]SMO36075.1 2-succinyl-6-hydroxy-2,4-cyclohexadiene-1-carboxylate synthase [Gracilimonas mengyeensis]